MVFLIIYKSNWPPPTVYPGSILRHHHRWCRPWFEDSDHDDMEDFKMRTDLLMNGTADLISTQILVFSGMAAFILWSIPQVVCSTWYVPKITKKFQDGGLGTIFPFLDRMWLFIWEERYNRLLNTFTPPTPCGFLLKEMSLPNCFSNVLPQPLGCSSKTGVSQGSNWPWAASAIGKLATRLPA